MKNDSLQFAKDLDLHLAWKRIKNDILEDKVFIKNPYEVSLIEHDIESWLRRIRQSIARDTYVPKDLYICDIPKGNNLIRPGGHLELSDRVIYTAVLSSAFDKIKNELEWAQGKVDFSYELVDDPSKIEWLKNPFPSWEAFRLKSLAEIHKGYTYVVVTDISAFYENIDISILISDLKEIGLQNAQTNILSKCLNRWAQVSGRGLPQGHSSSDILAKVYLNPVDELLMQSGFKHFRYVDDIRIFCKDLNEAKRSIVFLSEQLRRRGLNLQSSKTQILLADDAKDKIEGVNPILNQIKHNFVRDVATITGFDTYITVFMADEIIEDDTENDAIEIIEEAYKAYFMDRSDKFDKTLFRFLLTRLGKNVNKFAVESCLQYLQTHPEETKYILHYLSKCQVEAEVENEIIDFLNSNLYILPYQKYLILDWFCKREKINKKILKCCRDFLYDKNNPFYLRTLSREIICREGRIADHERIYNTYAAASSKDQCEIICALRFMENGRRNSFYSRVSKSSIMHIRAVAFAKNNGR